jgi:hypothetical protein
MLRDTRFAGFTASSSGSPTSTLHLEKIIKTGKIEHV